MNTVLERSEAMKFVLDGRTFDTATASTVAISRGITDDLVPAVGECELRYEHVLYRTPKGAFFVHRHETRKFAKGKPVVEDTAALYEAQGAVAWIVTTGAMVVDAEGLPLPPEA